MTTFDLAHYCPLLKDLFFKMQVNYLIARALVNILSLSAAVSVFLLLHGGLQVVRSTLKVQKFWAQFSLLLFFFVLLAFTSLPHFEAGLFALEDGLITAAIHVLAKKGLTA